MNGHFPKFRLDAVDTHSHVRDRYTEDFRYLFVALVVKPQQNQRAFQFAELANEPIKFLQLFPSSGKRSDIDIVRLTVSGCLVLWRRREIQVFMLMRYTHVDGLLSFRNRGKAVQRFSTTS